MNYLRLALILLLFAGAIMITVPRRIFEFEKSQLTDYQQDLQPIEMKNLKIVTDPGVNKTSTAYLDAVENLAWVYWQRNKLFDAEAWFRILVDTRKRALGKAYDPHFIKDQLCLAGVYRDWAHYYQAEAVYREIEEYEAKFFQTPDLHLARDYGNLSLNYYLEAAAETDKVKRKTMLTSAKAYSYVAEDQYEKMKNIKKVDTDRQLGNLLASRFYILRDLGLQNDADETKQRADKILAAANNTAVEP